ncbi:MAG: aminotransferase class I/II-fold pyridoxal phosphate-dependent enzyme [Jatrophihabitantaceae bacterium]
MSGIRSIMEDIAAAGGDPSGGEWINLSPGNPALIPEVVMAWRRMAEQALADDFIDSACRYGPSRGSHGLIAAIVAYFNDTYGWSIGPQNVVVGAGTQMLTFMATSIFTSVDKAERRPLVLPRLPDYAGYQGLVVGAGGIVGVEPVVVEEGERYFSYAVDQDALRQQAEMGMMLVSNPANPTGAGIDTAELEAIVSLAQERDVPLVLDHAYGQPFPAVAETPVGPVWHSHVINCFTFSKVGLPGERLGFAIGPVEAIAPMVSFTANAALHAPALIQTVAQRALASREIDVLTAEFITPYYRNKRSLVEKLLFEYLPASVSWRMHSGSGGMFCWLWIEEDWFDDLEMYVALKSKNVLVVPGRHFFIGPMNTPFLRGHGSRCIRMSMSGDESLIARGLQIISATLEELRRMRSSR